MEILDRAAYGSRRDEATIVTPAGLPEAVLNAGTTADPEIVQKLWLVVPDPLHRPSRDRLFDALEYRTDGTHLWTEGDQEMHVIEHRDPGPQFEVMAQSACSSASTKNPRIGSLDRRGSFL